MHLRRKVLQQVYGAAMQKVDLFKQCGDDFLAELMLKMRTEFAYPYAIIIHQGAIGDTMYIIRKGYGAVYRGKTRKDIQSTVILGAGQAFGEIALLAEGVTRTASIVALDWVDLCLITRDDFQELMSLFPRYVFNLRMSQPCHLAFCLGCHL